MPTPRPISILRQRVNSGVDRFTREKKHPFELHVINTGEKNDGTAALASDAPGQLAAWLLNRLHSTIGASPLTGRIRSCASRLVRQKVDVPGDPRSGERSYEEVALSS